MIVGLDEVGRGPWAGPLVFGAVVLGTAKIDGLTDSKKLTKKRREMLNDEILKHAEAVGLGWVYPDEIDTLGLSKALSLACQKALSEIHVPYQQIIIDGTVNFLQATGKGPYVTTIAKADLLIPSVSAASIVAKVARDAYMTSQDAIYPDYGFKTHAGYGTAKHREALRSYGVTDIHRKSFAPIAALLGMPTPAKSESKEASTTFIGNKAETAATTYLQHNGYKVIERNWKTKACEIDIIASKNQVIYFVEVKYRAKPDQGGGIAAITSTKLRQMNRAARLWFQRYGECDGQLVAVEVSGPSYEITQFLKV